VNNLVLVVAVLCLLACSASKTRDTDTSAVSAVSSTASAGTVKVATAEYDSVNWVVTEYGIGGLRAGMTVKEARAVVPGFEPAAGADSVGCDYATVPELPRGVSVMV
jgi:hypothetical protein